eukprot:380769-Amphidinium_carterae.1
MIEVWIYALSSAPSLGSRVNPKASQSTSAPPNGASSISYLVVKAELNDPTGMVSHNKVEFRQDIEQDIHLM